MKGRLFLLLGMLTTGILQHGGIRAQVPPSIDSLLTKALGTDELLPLLIDSAIKYSPLMKKAAGSIQYADENLQINKKYIFNSLSLLSSYYYGTNYSNINSAAGSSSLNNFTTTQNGFYNVGVGLQMPLSNIVSRKNLVRAGEAQVKIATADKDNTILAIKQEVIRLYQELKLSQRLLIVGGKNKESARINYNMAEKEFIEGQSSTDQVSRVMDIYNKTVIEYETFANRFQTSYMQMEAFTGANLFSLLKQMK